MLYFCITLRILRQRDMPELLTCHILCLSFEYFSEYRAERKPASGALDLMEHSSNYKVQESSSSFRCFFISHFYGTQMICNSVLVLMWWCMAAIRSFRNQIRFGSSTCTIWLLSEIWEVVWHFYQTIFSDALCLNHQWCIS